MLTSWRRFADRHPRLVESAFLLLLFVVTAAQGVGSGHDRWPGAVAASTAACCALLWRRRHPRPVVLVAAFCTGVAAATSTEVSALLLIPVIVALYELAVRSPERLARVYWLATFALIVPPTLPPGPDDQPWAQTAVLTAFWTVLPVVQGSAVRARRAYLEAVRTRAEHAERTREEEARRRVAEERLRIARELHDVVAHHMALANAQAGTAAHVLRSRPGQAERILAELGTTTSSALRELQATVGLLRASDEAEAPLEPTPGLARLPELAAAFSSAGLDVGIDVDGEQRPLPPGVDLTAFRIVQEALTNVTKHTAAGTARVLLTYSGDRLTLTVSDDGGALPRPPAPGGGFGLIGMRERARTAGGSLRAGHRPGGGFAVTAELPLRT
ncbi:sensor histidine kinase [Streptomyces griseoaurantiacus]|uniref:sensor histidine kinase n=1 Tax=Streptomyces griseoaurantiacus TaxID=68213 RepID=UPI002E2E373A|nr:histidine kinase [Streptomyces jietaisiensis]